MRAALDDGTLEARRFWRYLELRQEAEALQRRRDDPRHRGNAKARHKDLSKIIRRMKKERPR